MVRGLIFGVIWGGVFTALFLAVVSLLAPMPNPTSATMEPAPQPVTSEPGVMPADDPTPTPTMSSPSIEEAPVMGETTSAIMPSHGEADSGLADVSDANEAVPSVSAGDQPTTAAQSEAPSVPETDVGPSVEATSAEPVSASSSEAASQAMEQPSQTLQPDAPMSVDESVVTNRLPTITADETQIDEPVAAPATDDRPLMAIVLIDTGEFSIGPEALASFPYPISFAIDPLREDAFEAASKFSDKGFELLLTADLPDNGDGSLAEVALRPTLESFPNAVGLLEGSDTGLQGNMALAEGVLDMIEDTEHGLVLRAKGLNAAQQQAEGRDLPVDTVFRDFDANGQDATVIRRFLDQAAFKARQEGAVIMVGRIRPATISALLLWGLQDRATSVRLSPISEVLAR